VAFPKNDLLLTIKGNKENQIYYNIIAIRELLGLILKNKAPTLTNRWGFLKRRDEKKSLKPESPRGVFGQYLFY
jgi:hypothetical protein